ncbi:SDR family oxidoreductase [soil metagenome]|jgi:NADP-dependent 3-hydroxy acid dehydrogenase YdfG
MGTVLDGRRVLVTGASSGIGLATAEACLDAGARVAVLARRADRLQELADSRGAIPVAGDISQLDTADDLVSQAVEGLGGLDVLINSAGIARPGLIATADLHDWQDMFGVNVLGLLAITQAAIPHLQASDGGASIVNISSMSGRRVPSATGGTYAATKFAVHAISESLRQELQPAGVRVTTVSPGFVATELFDALEDSDVVSRYRRLATRVGIRPRDVAAAIVHAISAPDSVTTVEIAMVPTTQDDSTYSSSVDED